MPEVICQLSDMGVDAIVLRGWYGYLFPRFPSILGYLKRNTAKKRHTICQSADEYRSYLNLSLRSRESSEQAGDLSGDRPTTGPGRLMPVFMPVRLKILRRRLQASLHTHDQDTVNNDVYFDFDNKSSRAGYFWRIHQNCHERPEYSLPVKITSTWSYKWTPPGQQPNCPTKAQSLGSPSPRMKPHFVQDQSTAFWASPTPYLPLARDDSVPQRNSRRHLRISLTLPNTAQPPQENSS